MPRRKATSSANIGSVMGTETNSSQQAQPGQPLTRHSEATPSGGTGAKRGPKPGVKSSKTRASHSRSSAGTPSLGGGSMTATGPLNLNALQSQAYVALGSFITSMRACGVNARGISNIFNQHLSSIAT